MGYFICPYCNKECEADWEARIIDTVYEHECEHCEKSFVFTIDYDIRYDTNKADCLNGGEHNYEKICACPKELFENKRRCSICDKEKTIKRGKTSSRRIRR